MLSTISARSGGVNSIPADENLEPFATPLMAAVLADKEDVALHLLSLAGNSHDLDLGRNIDGGNTLLQYAQGEGLKTEGEMLAMAQFLIEQGAAVTVRNGWGQTPALAAPRHISVSRSLAAPVLAGQIGKK